MYWIIKRGSHVHDRLLTLIEHSIDEFNKLEDEGNSSKLNEIRFNSPNAIPDEQMRIIWRLFFTGRVKSSWRELDFYNWKRRLSREGLSSTVRMQLREILSPKIKLREPFYWDDEDTSEGTTRRLKQLVDWELVLEGDHVRSSMQNISDRIGDHHLVDLFDDIQSLLRDALDILKEMGEANERKDNSIWDLPSISEHWQNRGFRDWIVLIELLRDSWIEIKATDSDKARQIANNWFNLPYLTFKRLALFAASQDESIPPETWCEWLISENSWCLWAVETQRETMRLLALQGGNISISEKASLESIILSGPPRSMYPHVSDENWQSIVDKDTWLRLAKLNESGLELSGTTNSRLDILALNNPRWSLSPHQREEFPRWHTGTGSPDYEENLQIDIAPNNRRELIEWLKEPKSSSSFFHEDNWRELCESRFFLCLSALNQLAIDKEWPIDYWRKALQVWSGQGQTKRSWTYAAGLINEMPEDIFSELVGPISWWLQKVSDSVINREELLFGLCRRIMHIQDKDDIDRDDPVSSAINHPIGHVTQTLMNVWFHTEPNDNDTLPDQIEAFFTALCDVDTEYYRHGRVILASQLIPLFRVDATWSRNHLLPLFDWDRDATEAKASWEGFLWTPRIHTPLLVAIKPHFLDTANHYDNLGDHKRQYAAFLTYTALTHIDDYTSEDYGAAFEVLPREGLNEAADALNQALEGAGDQREDYLSNRVLPFWNEIWPKSLDLVSENISESLARMAINAGSGFPSALSAVIDWLLPVEYPDYTVHQLKKSDLCRRFPDDALRLLNAIIDNQQWLPRELSECLSSIIDAKPELVQDHRYQRLLEYSRS